MKHFILFTILLTTFTAKAGTWALEADALSFFLKGHSTIIRHTWDNGFEAAIGAGKFTLPSSIVEGEQNDYDEAEWEAESTSIQVARLGYRFGKAYSNGWAFHLIAMNQRWHVESEPLNLSTRYTVLATGLSAGYYIHLSKSFYLYPVVSVTSNNIYQGDNKIGGRSYDVPAASWSGSLHAGFEF
jgi:hypothetical protein